MLNFYVQLECGKGMKRIHKIQKNDRELLKEISIPLE